MVYPTCILDVGAPSLRRAELHPLSTVYCSFLGIQPLLDLRLNQLKHNAVEIFSLQDICFFRKK